MNFSCGLLVLRLLLAPGKNGQVEAKRASRNAADGRSWLSLACGTESLSSAVQSLMIESYALNHSRVNKKVCLLLIILQSQRHQSASWLIPFGYPMPECPAVHMYGLHYGVANASPSA